METSTHSPPESLQDQKAWPDRLSELAAIVLGLVLLFAAVTKMAVPQSFVQTVQSFGLFPDPLALPAATGLIAAEFSLGLMLMTGLYRRVAAWLNLMVLLVFIAILGDAIAGGRTEDCGCFGEAIKMKPQQEIFLDVALVALTLLVIWRGRDRAWGSPVLRTSLAWGSFCVGAMLFLMAGPGSGSSDAMEVSDQQLLVLTAAEPPIPIPDEGLIFLFSADCDHCWAYAGGVQMTTDRLVDFDVMGITYSDAEAVKEFEEFFAPSYPIHVVGQAAFDKLTDEYPSAIWVSQGRVEQAWSGFVPSHRDLADLGGYDLLFGPLDPEAAPAVDDDGAKTKADLFGGTVRGDN